MKYEVRLIENRVNKKQLQQEKERLLERIAEIDKLLSEYKIYTFSTKIT